MRRIRKNRRMPAPTDSSAFASTLSAAMVRSGITLTALRDGLLARGHPISLTALSYWRSGLRLPERRGSLEALPVLEALLHLEPGALAKLVAGPAARRLGPVEPFDALIDYPLLDPAEGEEFRGESDISRVSTHVTVHVGADREIVSTRIRRLVVANRDGVEDMTVFLGTDDDHGTQAYRFRAVDGCAIHEEHQPAHNVRRVQLRFPRPLMRGESALTEVEVTLAEDASQEIVDDYEVYAEQRLEEILIWVNFDPRALPRRCWVYFAEGDLKHEWPVDIEGSPSVHYRQRDFGPGGLGIRWEW